MCIRDSGKIDTVYFTTVTVAKVTYASASQIVAGGTTYKHADENIADGIAKNDWVIITENAYNNNKDIAKAEMTKATIQGYKDETTYHQYRVDGTWSVSYTHLDVYKRQSVGKCLDVYILGLEALDLYANHEQKMKYLAPCCSGEQTVSFAFTEPETCLLYTSRCV